MPIDLCAKTTAQQNFSFCLELKQEINIDSFCIKKNYFMSIKKCHK